QLRVLRMAFVRYTLQAGHSISTAVAFMGFDDRVTTAGAMSIRAEFLLEGGGGNRLIGVGSVPMGVTGNLLADTFTVDYAVPVAPAPPQAPPDNRAGNAREDPGGATPMIDTSRVNSGQEPLGTNQPFRSTSADAL